MNGRRKYEDERLMVVSYQDIILPAVPVPQEELLKAFSERLSDYYS